MLFRSAAVVTVSAGALVREADPLDLGGAVAVRAGDVALDDLGLGHGVLLVAGHQRPALTRSTYRGEGGSVGARRAEVRKENAYVDLPAGVSMRRWRRCFQPLLLSCVHDVMTSCMPNSASGWESDSRIGTTAIFAKQEQLVSWVPMRVRDRHPWREIGRASCRERV